MAPGSPGRTDSGTGASRRAPPPPRLYLVADRGAFESDEGWLEALRRLDAVLARLGPVDDLATQLRVKEPLAPGAQQKASLLSRGLDALAAARRAGVPAYVNGTTEEASGLGADGAHWPEALIPAAPPASGGPPASIESVASPGLGESSGERLRHAASVHSEQALQRARRAGADFVVYGPVFEPGSKPGTGVGLDALAAIAGSSPLPVVAIGGITAERARSCLEAGAAGVAVVSEVFGRAPGPDRPGHADVPDRPDPASAVAAMLRSLR